MLQSTNELEKALTELNQSTRDPVYRQRTLAKLKQHHHKPNKPFKPLWIGLLTTITFTLFAWFMVASLAEDKSSPPAEEATHPYVEIITNHPPTGAFVAKNQSLHSFKPKEYPLLPGVVKLESDPILVEFLTSAITNMKLEKDIPSQSPDADLLVVLENHEALKFKIWLSEKAYYVKPQDEETYYRLATEDQQALMNLLIRMGL